ncbi:MAG TPA: Rrf2 family transcriptional regulator [Chloroflexota bacterium]|jgi:Rrf2 family protein|nr:Rrf2 family transcriptional regulator [Chloroflexota bacterium]
MARPTNTQFAVAVHVLTLLAHQPDEPVSSNDMASSVGTNAVHIRRVLAHLRRASLVASRPGIGGGWRLEREASLVTLGDVWRAIQRDDPLLALHDESNPACPIGRRIQGTLSQVAQRAAHAVAAELDRITVADVLRDTVAGAPPPASVVAAISGY